MTSHIHKPVMIDEALEHLAIKDDVPQIFIDATFGRGGYSRAILDASKSNKVIAFDQDPDAQAFAKDIQATYKDRFHLAESNFRHMNSYLSEHSNACMITGDLSVDGIVFDLGLSSPQLDNADRGFSFNHDGPIDMRMSKSGKSAQDVINSYDEEKLADIIFHYGEEKKSRAIARQIVHDRKTKPFETTFELKKSIYKIIPRKFSQKIDPATRTFQGIRIYVNDELNAFHDALLASELLLKEDGRLVIVDFHSLEDRIAKNFIQACAVAPSTAISDPFSRSNKDENFKPSFNKVTKKPLTASQGELSYNPRARSAKLRSAIRTQHPAIGPPSHISQGGSHV